jgi:chaperonin GroES
MNTSGFEPLDLRVLVLPDPVEEKTAGGIILPDTTGEREKYAMMFGTLVAVGENAWEEASARSPNFNKPQVGGKIVFAKYGGIEIKGRDGKQYRLMNDEDVIGRVTVEA